MRIVHNLGASCGDAIPTALRIARREADEGVGLQPRPGIGEAGEQLLEVGGLRVAVAVAISVTLDEVVEVGFGTERPEQPQAQVRRGRFLMSSYERTMPSTLRRRAP
jgi:hypothetical protein